MIILRPCVELMHYFYSYWVNEYPVRIITFPYYFKYEGKPLTINTSQNVAGRMQRLFSN
jgi:hypothetical protein